jgi:hypothetical protein
MNKKRNIRLEEVRLNAEKYILYLKQLDDKKLSRRIDLYREQIDLACKQKNWMAYELLVEYEWQTIVARVAKNNPLPLPEIMKNQELSDNKYPIPELQSPDDLYFSEDTDDYINDENQQFLNHFGAIPDKNGLKRRMRIHQGWWRMNVLQEEAGKHPLNKDKNVCNTINSGIENKKNFLTKNIIKTVDQTITNRNKSDAGMIEPDRLYNNLLSSQPLCFNFFGELLADREFGLRVLQNWWPELTELKKVKFEYAPEETYTHDNSAFDIAFEVAKGKQTGLIGLECKYTDTFSSTVYDKPVYNAIYIRSDSFSAGYNDLKAGKYNQLFRNQLLAEAIIQHDKYDFVKTGLFCYQLDKNAIRTAQEFQEMLTSPDSFKIITYSNFIENIQRLDLSWEQREWTMLLWARYCATILSEPTNEQIELIQKNQQRY